MDFHRRLHFQHRLQHHFFIRFLLQFFLKEDQHLMHHYQKILGLPLLVDLQPDLHHYYLDQMQVVAVFFHPNFILFIQNFSMLASKKHFSFTILNTLTILFLSNQQDQIPQILKNLTYLHQLFLVTAPNLNWLIMQELLHLHLSIIYLSSFYNR